MKEIRVRTVDGKSVFDIELERNEELVGVLRSVLPEEITIHNRQVAAAASTDLVQASQAPAVILRNRAVPIGLVPITIQGEVYFINSNFWANKEFLKSHNLLH